jgi:hypothetical protein
VCTICHPQGCVRFKGLDIEGEGLPLHSDTDITINTIEMRAAFRVLERRGLLQSSELQQAIRETSSDETARLMEEIHARVMQAIILRFPNLFAPSPPIR